MISFFNKKEKVEKQDELHCKDSFRDLQTSLVYKLENGEGNIIVISSSNKEEGKSFCALELALSFGENNKRVLLVDMDLHRPRLSKKLTNDFLGLTSIYFQGKKMDECTIQLEENVQFLQCGPTAINPAEIINSSVIKEQIYLAANNVDIVIIDAPPIRAISDTKAIIKEFKNLLFVVRSGKTRSHEIEEAFEKIKIVNPNVLGTVLTMKKVSKEKKDAYMYY